MAALAVIPARYGSTRFPGKPLAMLRGRPLIAHTLAAVQRAATVDDVVVAVDDARVARVVESFGGRAVMTGDCATGTDRVVQAVRQWPGEPPALVVNVQGDEPFVDAAHIDRLVERLRAEGGAAGMATLAAPLPPQLAADPHVVKVVLDHRQRAMHFSRAPMAGGLHHIGVYAFTREALLGFPGLPRSPLEELESLEQLRALQAGVQIAVEVVEGAAGGVDTLEQLSQL